MNFKGMLGLLFGIGIILQAIGLKKNVGSRLKLMSQVFIIVYVVLIIIPTFFTGLINGLLGK